MRPWPGLLPFVVAASVVAGCGTAHQFQAGVAAISGKGGTIARNDAFPAVVQAAALYPGQPATQWQTIFPDDATDFMEFLDGDRVLVGTINVGAYLGTPTYKRLIMYEASTGRQLWEAERPGNPGLTQQLLSTAPAVVIAATEGKRGYFRAFSPDSGKPLWQLDADQLVEYAASDSAGLLYTATIAHEAIALEARDLASGATRWTRQLESFKHDSTATLIVSGSRVLVLGAQVLAFNAGDGSPAWPAERAPAGLDSGTTFQYGNDVVLWNAHAIQVIEPSARVRWKRQAAGGGHKLATIIGDRLLRVEVPGVAGDTLHPDVIEALDTRSGEPLWKVAAAGTLVSSFAVDGKTLIYTTPDSLVAIDLDRGTRIYTRRFPRIFRLGSPTRAVALALADRIMIDSGRLYVARERGGVIAYTLSTGHQLWFAQEFQQGAVAGWNSWYSAPVRFSGLVAALATVGAPPPPTSTQSASILFTTPNPHGPVAAAAHSWDIWFARKLIRDRNRLQRTRTYRYPNEAGYEQQTLSGFTYALLDLSSAIETSLKNSAQQGLVQRFMFGVQSATWVHDRAFQNGYYVQPINFGAGWGVTIVDLAHGKRADLVTSPFIKPVLDFGLDLGGFAIDPERKRVLAIGTGLDTTRYQPVVKWQWRIPNPSLLGYDLAELHYTNIPVVDPDSEARFEALPLLAQLRVREDSVTKARAAGVGSRGLYDAVATGDTVWVAKWLANGANVNELYQGSIIPLLYAAAMNQPAIVRQFLERGANVNATNPAGRTALDFTTSEEIKEVLRAAGGKPGKGKKK